MPSSQSPTAHSNTIRNACTVKYRTFIPHVFTENSPESLSKVSDVGNVIPPVNPPIAFRPDDDYFVTLFCYFSLRRNRTPRELPIDRRRPRRTYCFAKFRTYINDKLKSPSNGTGKRSVVNVKNNLKHTRFLLESFFLKFATSTRIKSTVSSGTSCGHPGSERRDNGILSL